MRIFVKTPNPTGITLKTWMPVEYTDEGILVENNQYETEFPELNELEGLEWKQCSHCEIKEECKLRYKDYAAMELMLIIIFVATLTGLYLL